MLQKHSQESSRRVHQTKAQLICCEPSCTSLGPILCTCRGEPRFCSKHYKNHVSNCASYQKEQVIVHTVNQDSQTNSLRQISVKVPDKETNEPRPISELFKRLANEQTKAEVPESPNPELFFSSSSESEEVPSTPPKKISEPHQPQSEMIVPVTFAHPQVRAELTLEGLFNAVKTLEIGCKPLKKPGKFSSFFCGAVKNKAKKDIDVIDKLQGFGSVLYDATDRFHTNLVKWLFTALSIPDTELNQRILFGKTIGLNRIPHVPVSIYLFLVAALLTPSKTQAIFSSISKLNLVFIDVLTEISKVFLQTATSIVAGTIQLEEPIGSYALFYIAISFRWLDLYIESRPISVPEVTSKVASILLKNVLSFAHIGKQLYEANRIS